MREKDYVCNLATCFCENGKYLVSIIDDSTVMCNEVMETYNEETKAISTNFNEKKATCKTQNFHILLAFLLIAIKLLIAVRIYGCLIKYQARQKHLLPFCCKNN